MMRQPAELVAWFGRSRYLMYIAVENSIRYICNGAILVI